MKIKKVAILGGIVTAITAAAVYAIILTNESLKNIVDAFDVEDEDY
jgi:flavin-binding protein dodecin